MDAGAGAIINGAQAAVTRLPGGPVLSAADRTPAGGVSSGPTTAAEGPTGTAGGGASPGGGGVEDALTRNADMNLYYLELQERISAESRAYSTLSNVLKARHDTVKNAIGNIR
jgi:hypothetical protein